MSFNSRYTELAYRAIEKKIRTGEILDFEKFAQEIKDDPWVMEAKSLRAGAFVSLYSNNELRGCIGTVEGLEDHVGEEIIRNAIEAALFDSRFPPLDKEELNRLTLSVDILKEQEPVNNIEDLDPNRYGIIVEHDGKRGLLLPDLDGVDTAEKQLDIAAKKAGIMEGEKMQVYRFEVLRYN